MSSDHLGGFLQLPHVSTDEERRSVWRQSMATLARAAIEQQPVPLEGIDPELLLQTVRAAFQHNLVSDLSWLSPPAAAAAVYELAAAIPMGPERRQLGREVLMRLYEGDAATFVVLATSLAAESKRTLTGAAIRARVALALELPMGTMVPADMLALKLISRPDLRREWLSDPATGSLPSRRLAARLLERAARESARRAAQGDAGSLRAFEEPAVRAAWRILLADRESLVWRHVAVARGLLSRANPEFAEEIEHSLDPHLTPTEWRRGAVSLVASIALTPERALDRCRAVLADETLRGDPGLAGTMIFGIARAAEVEPEAAQDLLDQIVRLGGLEAAEALVELHREGVDAEFGSWAKRYARDRVLSWLETQRFDDDGRIALCEALVEELSPGNDRPPSLRDELDAALAAFTDDSARTAYVLAQSVLQRALNCLTELEGLDLDDPQGRRKGFRAMRELDVALLETATLGDLLMIRERGNKGFASPLAEVFERMSACLLDHETVPITGSGGVEHLTLRLRRLRTLLHLVDADGSYGEDTSGKRQARRLRAARTLLLRARDDAPSPLRRIVCAALARACDALLRDEMCELSDVLVAIADNVSNVPDLTTLAEASMIADLQRALAAYAELLRVTQHAKPTGRHARAALDALHDLAQSLPWTSTLRVSALRQGLLRLSRELETIAAAHSVQELSEDAPRRAQAELESTAYSLAQLTIGARRRLLPKAQRPVPASGSAISILALQLERAARGEAVELPELLRSIEDTLRLELPEAVARAAAVVLGRIGVLTGRGIAPTVDSFLPPTPKEAPLPPWLPGRRIIGGFYVVRSLGTGGVGSVFVVMRAEERHQDHPHHFALKVPDYSAEAARTLSEEEFLKLFREEAGALLSLPKHTNLARFVTFDAGAKPKPILVMELVEGPTLERLIERGDMTMPLALHLLEGIADGLCGMHEVGIGHLDVKPSNVILRTMPRASMQQAEPVLVDFGLAGRHLRPGCATGPYGAPEIWGLMPEGATPRPASADVYAFACLAYEVLTGDTLFDAPGELAVISLHLAHDGYPDKLLALRQNPKLTAVCDLIANGLRQDPAERVSMDEMREGFRELGNGLRQLSWPLAVYAAA